MQGNDHSGRWPPEQGKATGSKLPMERRLTPFFLVILIFLSIPLFSTYLDHCELTGVGLLVCDISFENPGQDNLSMDRLTESEVLLSNASSIRYPPGMNLSEQFAYFPSARCSLDEKTFILRC